MKIPPSKFAVGEPMIEWCERNGLDAYHIPDRSDAIEITEEPDGLSAVVLYIASDKIKPQDVRDVIEAWGDGDSTHFRFRAPVDSRPPLNPEWVQMFGTGAVTTCPTCGQRWNGQAGKAS